MINSEGYGNFWQMLLELASGLVVMKVLLIHLRCLPHSSVPEIHVAAHFSSRTLVVSGGAGREKQECGLGRATWCRQVGSSNTG